MWCYGGITQFCTDILNGFDNNDASILLVCEKTPQDFDLQVKNRNLDIVETGLSGIGSGTTVTPAIGWLLLQNSARKVTNKLSQIKPDILNPQSFIDVFYSAYYKLHLDPDVKIRWYAHEPYRWFYDKENWRYGSFFEQVFFAFYRQLFVPSDKKNVRVFVDSIGSNSKFTAALVKDIYKRESQIIYPGIDTDKFKPSKPVPKVLEENALGNSIILSVGRIQFSTKNLQVIPAVLQKIRSKRKVIWIHIGTGADEPRLLDAARAYGVADYLKILPPDLVHYELSKFYSAADVVVYPSVKEPFGLVPVEAMACETPVVASKFGGTSETIVNGTTGILVDTNSVYDISKAIFHVLSNKEVAAAMGRAGRRHVCAEFSLRKTIDAYQRFVLAQ